MLERTGFVDYDALAREAAGTSTASPSGPPVSPGNTVPQVPVPVTPSGDQSFTSRPVPPTLEPLAEQ